MADRTLTVKIVGDSRSLERAFKNSSQAAGKFKVSMGTIVKGALAFGLVSEGIGLVGSAVRSAASEFSDAAKAAAQTEAVLRSTGGVANVTAKQVDDLANAIQQKSGIDDEAVKSGENLLLTFKNVRNEVGKGNAIFDRATKAAVDLSVAGFGSIDTTAKQIGKALNDPVKGMTALGRAGVTFTKSQQDQIKSLVKSNNLLGAQRLILKEVESQVGGSAKALGQTLPGQLNRLRESFKNTLGDIASKVAPTLNRALGFVNDFIGKFSAAQTVHGKIRVVIDAVRGLQESIRDRIREVDFQQIAQTIGNELRSVDWSAVGTAISNGIKDALGAVAAFLRSVDWGVVGREIVNGIGRFLKGVDWVGLAVGTVKLLVAAFKAEVSLLLGIGRTLGGALLRGLQEGLRRAAAFIGKQALKVALAIVEPLNFTILGKHVIPGLNSLVKSMKAKLAQIEASAAAAENAAKSAENIRASAKGLQPEASEHLRGGDTPTTAAKKATAAAAQTVKATKVVTKATEDHAKAAKKAAEATKKQGQALAALSPLANRVMGPVGQLTDALKKNAELTRGRAVSSSSILSGLGLDRDTFKILQQRLARIGANGRVLPGTGRGTQSAFGFALAGTGGDIVIRNVVELDGQKVSANTTRHQQKRKRRQSSQTTGPFAGQ